MSVGVESDMLVRFSDLEEEDAIAFRGVISLVNAWQPC
jgi:hypothetical protein